MRLIDERMPDGSRRFMTLAQQVDWDVVYENVSSLAGSRIINFVANGGALKRLDFHYLGNRFLISGQNGHVNLSVDDPQCSDLILYHVSSVICAATNDS